MYLRMLFDQALQVGVQYMAFKRVDIKEAFVHKTITRLQTKPLSGGRFVCFNAFRTRTRARLYRAASWMIGRFAIIAKDPKTHPRSRLVRMLQRSLLKVCQISRCRLE